jgi:hypothetical protein
MNILSDILNANTQSQLEAFTSIPSVLSNILSKTYEYNYTKIILEFATNVEYNNYIVPNTVTINPNVIKTVNTSQIKELIEYEIVTSITSVSNKSYNTNYINRELITNPVSTNNILSYQYKALLYPFEQNYINTTKLVYRGALRQNVNVVYNVNSETDFYLLDKYSVQDRNKFTYMPKETDPFYAQKIILLEIYNAPTVDSNAYLRKTINNNSNSLLVSVLFFNTFAILISYIGLFRKKTIRNLVIALFLLIGLITIVTSLSIMVLTNNYNYQSFTTVNKYIEDMNGFNTINDVSSITWICSMIIIAVFSIIIA